MWPHLHCTPTSTMHEVAKLLFHKLQNVHLQCGTRVGLHHRVAPCTKSNTTTSHSAACTSAMWNQGGIKYVFTIVPLHSHGSDELSLRSKSCNSSFLQILCWTKPEAHSFTIFSLHNEVLHGSARAMLGAATLTRLGRSTTASSFPNDPTPPCPFSNASSSFRSCLHPVPKPDSLFLAQLPTAPMAARSAASSVSESDGLSSGTPMAATIRQL